MNRKKFLSSIVGGATLMPAAANLETVNALQDDRPAIIPPYLKAGDLIGITSPAGFITLQDIQPAIAQIKSWGFNVQIGKTIGKKFFNFGGTDEDRRSDLQSMMDDPKLKAILCARGGYGIVRFIDQLNFTLIQKYPKWIIGFSDVSILHAHLNSNVGLASLHSKMCNSFPKSWSAAEPVQVETINAIHEALSGMPLRYSVIPSAYNRPGIAEGVLIGGNLKLIESMAGTASDLYTNGKILFVEDTGEYLYSIDRMFCNLKRSGKLIGLKALIVGGFKIKPDDPGEEFGFSLQQIVLDKVRDYQYPVCFDFPVGHQKNNFPLKCGVRHKLAISASSCTLEEII